MTDDEDKHGTCTGCSESFKLAKNRKIPDHRQELSSRLARDCSGAGRYSKEHYDARQERNRAKRQESVVGRIGESSVMLDALLMGRKDLDEHLATLRKAAMTKLRLQYPNYITHNDGFNMILRVRGDRVRDAYCVFCGDHIRAVPVDVYTRHVGELVKCYEHSDVCAMRYLTGMIDAVKPGTRTVPDQLSFGDDSETRLL